LLTGSCDISQHPDMALPKMNWSKTSKFDTCYCTGSRVNSSFKI
jgi:hypothetical protein